MPGNASEVPPGWAPSNDQTPLLCLLEDDALITRVNVEVAELLSPQEQAGNNYCEIVIRVQVRAVSPTYGAQVIIS
ncbi:MAG: hypothetical protein LC775_00625 [Acidobacteria bacterium]|nr:hypothetical protein [Acidobacteriota bacterium]